MSRFPFVFLFVVCVACDKETNAVPSAPVVELSPDPAGTADDLVASIITDSLDSDGDPITYSFEWVENGEPSAASTSSTLPSSATETGDTWMVIVTPNDGLFDGDSGYAEITIENAAPVVSAVTITPDPGFAGDTLTCAYTYSDVDSAPDSSTVYWDINGTGAGSGSYLTGGFVNGDAVTCTVTANDGIEDGNTESASIVISNTAPVLEDVTLSPDPAVEGDSLSCVPGATTDADGTLGFGYETTWFVNGVDVGSTESMLDGTHFDKYDDVYCSVVPNDGDDDGDAVDSNTVTIDNTVPTIASVSIDPTNPTVEDTLTCTHSGFSDEDGDGDISTYVWTVGGVEVGMSDTLSGLFVAGETATCTVTPYDGEGEGTPLSDSVVIENSEPEVTSVTLSPSTVYTNDTITATVLTEDADGDSVSVSYAWTVDGTVVAETGSTLDGATYFDKDQEVYVVVTPNDGSDDGGDATSSTITVTNTAPESPTISIDPEDPVAGTDDLICQIDGIGSDDDGDSISHTFAWDVDGATYTDATTTDETGDTVSTDDILEGEVWTCTVTPYDGDEDGSVASISVTVEAGGPQTISLSLADYSFTGEDSYHYAGLAISPAGDVDDDGLDDFLVFAQHDLAQGKTYLILGSSLGSTSSIDLSTSGYSFIGEASSDMAGFSMSSAGDVDDDGLDDLLIGAYGNDDGGSSAGKVYLILGSSLGSTSTIDLSAADYSFTGESSTNYAGFSVSSAGDVDNDGMGDILIGAYGNGSLGGQAYLILGGSLGSTSSIDLSAADYDFYGADSYDYAGIDVSSAGDVDADGFDDILIGANGNDDGGNNAGSAHLILGGSRSVTTSIDLSTADYSFIGEGDNESAGRSVSGAGDVNADGFDDILIGAHTNSDGGSSAGKGYLILGSSLGSTTTVDLSAADYSFVGEAASDWAAFSVSSAGDVDDDGQDDVLIGAYGNDDGGPAAGKVYLILSD